MKLWLPQFLTIFVAIVAGVFLDRVFLFKEKPKQPTASEVWSTNQFKENTFKEGSSNAATYVVGTNETNRARWEAYAKVTNEIKRGRWEGWFWTSETNRYPVWIMHPDDPDLLVHGLFTNYTHDGKVTVALRVSCQEVTNDFTVWTQWRDDLDRWTTKRK